MFDEKDIKRFWSKIKIGKPDECWLWLASKDRKGYGQFRHAGKRLTSSRIAYMLSHGDIPNGMVIAHHCDTPSCCNPNCLFLTDQKGNMKDCAEKEEIIKE